MPHVDSGKGSRTGQDWHAQKLPAVMVSLGSDTGSAVERAPKVTAIFISRHQTDLMPVRAAVGG